MTYLIFFLWSKLNFPTFEEFALFGPVFGENEAGHKIYLGIKMRFVAIFHTIFSVSMIFYTEAK